MSAAAVRVWRLPVLSRGRSLAALPQEPPIAERLKRRLLAANSAWRALPLACIAYHISPSSVESIRRYLHQFSAMQGAYLSA